MSSSAAVQDRLIRTTIPARMHDMPWSRFHWMVIFGLGTAWILDGLEVQIVASGGFEKSLSMTPFEVTVAGTVYLVGEVVGALVFGRLTDTWGRKKMFTLTLALYLLGSAVAAFSPNMWFFLACRFVSGMGIGGEYSAVNSAIDELIPGKYRGRVDLAINGTYWFGAAIGAFASTILLNTENFDENLGWRIAFMIGPILGLAIIYLRRHIPESPRWMVRHGHDEAAERIVSGIEDEVRKAGKEPPKADEEHVVFLKKQEGLTPQQLAYVFFKLYPTRTVLGATLMITQSFLYNAIFFTYSLVLQNFYKISASEAALYFFPFAIGNLLGPLVLGPLFDTVGRRKMIGGCYAISGLVLVLSAWLFLQQSLTPLTHTAFWCVAFFFASAGASAGYLTVSEIFPQEARGQAISYFFSIAQVFGALGPVFYGWLIGDASTRTPMFWGYVIAMCVMLFGALVAFVWGVDAEGKSLEEIAPPLIEYDENGNETNHIRSEERRDEHSGADGAALHRGGRRERDLQVADRPGVGRGAGRRLRRPTGRRTRVEPADGRLPHHLRGDGVAAARPGPDGGGATRAAGGRRAGRARRGPPGRGAAGARRPAQGAPGRGRGRRPAGDRRAAGAVDVPAAGAADRVRRRVPGRRHAAADLRAARERADPGRARGRQVRRTLPRHRRPRRLSPTAPSLKDPRLPRPRRHGRLGAMTDHARDRDRDYEQDSLVGDAPLRIRARGRSVLSNPMTNRGTAFTPEERSALDLDGLVPTGITTLENQTRRIYDQFKSTSTMLGKFLTLNALRDRNEVLFYNVLTNYLEEMLPVIYTPTIGEAIERFSHTYNRPRGVFLSIDHPDQIGRALLNYGLGPDDVDLVCVTDSEGILGIGDQGVGGIQIAIGKLSVYTAAAGIHPRRVIPVVLDVGTDNLGLLSNDLYLGERHSRVRGERYDEFIDRFVTTVQELFPKAMIHWEDVGTTNAHRILERYREDVCTFNDDIQGTAAVVLAAILAAVNVTGVDLDDHRIVVFGAGSAGIGIANLVRDTMLRTGAEETEEEAYARFWAIGLQGLYVEGDPSLLDFQRPYARKPADIEGWELERPGHVGLMDVVRNVKPTILIGTSTKGGAFSQEIVEEMARHTTRPIIFPLSNPTSRAEATPADLIEWTDGQALIATGSPFAPVSHKGVRHVIAQSNNALIFPGLGLGVAACRARKITEGMIAAAADALAGLVNAWRPGASLLPGISDLRLVSATVAIAVAEQAAREGVADNPLSDPIQQVVERMWQPQYPRIEAI